MNNIEINMLIELKKELNEVLIEDISPSVFDGILQIYNGVKQMSNDTTIMKTFQKCMEKICDWKENKEVKNVIDLLKKRLSNDDKFTQVTKTIDAILGLNTRIFYFNSSDLNSQLENTKLITNEKFIKKVYVESARRLWSQPYLFYESGLNSIEIKRNHIIILGLIKESISSAIRKLTIDSNAIQKIIDNTYSIKYNNEQAPQTKYIVEQNGGNLNEKDEILNIINKNLKVSESDKSIMKFNQPNDVFNNYTPEKGNILDVKSSSTLKKIVNESFQNNNHNSKENTNSSRESLHKDSRHSSKDTRYSPKDSRYSSKDTRHSSKDSRYSSRDSRHSTRYNTATNNISINTSVKNNLIKDLMTETVSYNPEDKNEKYQDIFSNSEIPDNLNRKVSKNLNREKENFYNSYLKK